VEQTIQLLKSCKTGVKRIAGNHFSYVLQNALTNRRSMSSNLSMVWNTSRYTT